MSIIQRLTPGRTIQLWVFGIYSVLSALLAVMFIATQLYLGLALALPLLFHLGRPRVGWPGPVAGLSPGAARRHPCGHAAKSGRTRRLGGWS